MSDNQYALTQRVPAKSHTVLVSPALLDSLRRDAEHNADLAAEGYVEPDGEMESSYKAADGFGK